DVCETCREIIISSEQRINERDLSVSLDCKSDNMYVLADKDAVHQIIYNLVDNAIKYSTKGTEFVISIKEEDNKIQVSVFNYGEGISEEDLPHVFERFYKTDKSRGLDKSGSGLGLYIAKTICEAHGERIYAESKHGSWCKFTFTLEKCTKPRKKTADSR
ncbi:MAG: HAMP domain-containing histidine kinase, partial [Clostridia bacterium]|nr:HAMP domain-containing histidine kinase [Clostridia bacterium]